MAGKEYIGIKLSKFIKLGKSLHLTFVSFFLLFFKFSAFTQVPLNYSI